MTLRTRARRRPCTSLTTAAVLASAVKQAHWPLDATIADVDDELAGRPAPGNANPLGTAYAHVVHAEDAVVDGLLQGRDVGVDPRGEDGCGPSDADVAGLDDEALGRGIDLSFVGLGEKPASEVITMLVVQHCDNLSGEISAVKAPSASRATRSDGRPGSGGAAAASTMAQFWGGSSVGRALHSHCRGQGFESPSLHSKTAGHRPILSFSASASVPPGRVQAARFPDGPRFRGLWVLADLGHRPDRWSEEVTARMPTAKEMELLRPRPNVPVLSVVRITRDKEGQALQALRIVAAADRNVFVYDDLPIKA